MVDRLRSHCNLQVQGGEYTHVLHGRYNDKAALKAYLVHPDHVSIQQKYIQPLTEDIIALDWECIPCGPYIESVGAKRITFVKVKPETTADDMRFLDESISELPSKYVDTPKAYVFVLWNITY